MTLRKLFVAGALAITTTGPAWASDYLVDTDWVEKNIDNPKVRIIEVSVNPGLFERGHIPGAVNLNWHTDLVDTVNRDIASREQLQTLLRKAGVSKDTTTILYGDSNNWFAAWGAWVFDVYQIDNVKLLDGGRKKWEDEKRPLASVVKTYKAGDVTLAEADKSLRAFLPDVVAAAKKEADVALIDIRGPDEYSGKLFAAPGFQELAIRAGHVPGAVNVPWGQAVAEDGTFKSKEELKKLYASKGVDGSKPIITYCRIGERSSHTWFALSKILGYDVRNYDGSWTEYGNSVGVPITNLAGTVWGNQ